MIQRTAGVLVALIAFAFWYMAFGEMHIRALADEGFLLFLVSGAMIAGTISNERRRIYQREKVMARPGAADILKEIDQLLEAGEAIFYQKACMYLANQYAVCGKELFEYVDIRQCVEVRRECFRWEIRRRASLVLTDIHGEEFRVGVIPDTAANMKLHQEMIRQIHKINPDTFYTGEVHVGMLEMEEKEAMGRLGRVQGSIGAVLGAVVGAFFWLVISEFGFVAAIAGVVMVILALSGYRLFGGRIDRKGAIFAMATAFVLIIPVNLAANIWALYQEIDAGTGSMSFVHMLRNITYYMSEYQLWGKFLMNLLIGYLLVFWTNWRTIQEVMKKEYKQFI